MLLATFYIGYISLEEMNIFTSNIFRQATIQVIQLIIIYRTTSKNEIMNKYDRDLPRLSIHIIFQILSS
jgi:hypothetical protein